MGLSKTGSFNWMEDVPASGVVDFESGVEQKTLVGIEIPRVIPGNFHCSYLELTTLENVPDVIGGNLYCNNNALITLDWFPLSVGGNLYCDCNPKLPKSELYKIVDRVNGEIYYRKNVGKRGHYSIRNWGA